MTVPAPEKAAPVGVTVTTSAPSPVRVTVFARGVLRAYDPAETRMVSPSFRDGLAKAESRSVKSHPDAPTVTVLGGGAVTVMRSVCTTESLPAELVTVRFTE